jgi:flotillin
LRCSNSDAAKYQKEVDAAAELEQRKRKAEAERYEAEQKAAAVKAQAEADLFARQQEAAGIKAVGEAEAAAIKAKGEAEAVAMDKKAEAYKKYNGAAIAEMMVKILPEVAARVAEPLTSINDVHVYGTSGSEAAGISGNVPVVMRQTMEVIKEATGVDMASIMQNNSQVIAGEAKIKK